MELINLTPYEYSPLITKCQIKVCWVGDEPNRNRTLITKETAMEIAPSLRGAPIVGYYNEEKEDFEAHNLFKIENGSLILKPETVPYGFVDLNAEVWFQDFLDKDGVQREYLCTSGWLWTKQFPECQRIIEEGNNQSMELDKDLFSGKWANLENPLGKVFIINEAVISKLCILGEECEPCFEGASITEFSLGDTFKEQLYSVINDISNILKGGNEVEEVVKEPVAEETIAEESTPVEENVEEPTGGNFENYNLEEISEYVELRDKYALIEAELAQLKEAFSLLETEKNELTEFKLATERKEKEALIDSFYMLSNEQKADVRENINTYSLEDIKSKLCVICVDNKVGFAEEVPAEPITYSLNDVSASNEEDVPDWIKAVKAINN